MRDDLHQLVDQLRAIGPISPRLQVEIISERYPDFELQELSEAIHALGAPEPAKRIRRAALQEEQRQRAGPAGGENTDQAPNHNTRRIRVMAAKQHSDASSTIEGFIALVEANRHQLGFVQRCIALLLRRAGA